MSDTEAQQREAWIAEARALGVEHAKNAASWTVEADRYDVEAIRLQLRMMAEGDPRADEHLPERPNLSGEWADSLTVVTLTNAIVPDDALGAMDETTLDTLQDELADAYEEGVFGTFEDECERVLRSFLPDGGIA